MSHNYSWRLRKSLSSIAAVGISLALCGFTSVHRAERVAVAPVAALRKGQTYGDLRRGLPRDPDPGYFFAYFQNSSTGYCLNVQGASRSNGAQIEQWNCVGNGSVFANNIFGVPTGTPMPYGHWFLGYDSAQCLNVQGGSLNNSAKIISYTCVDNDDEQFVYQGGQIINFYSAKCLSVQGGSRVLGAPIIQYTCNGAANEYWTLNQY